MKNRLEVEKAMIGCILMNAENGRARSILRDVRPEYFGDSQYRTIFETAEQLAKEGIAPTPENLASSVPLSDNNAKAALVSAYSLYTSGANQEILVRRLIECFGLAEIQRLGTAAQQPNADLFELLKHLELVNATVGRAVTNLARPSKEEQVDAVHQYFEDRKAGRIRPIATGFPLLDKALHGGLSDGGLSYLVGPGGYGKTSLALAIAVNAARVGFNVHFIEGEMTHAQIHRRGTLMTQGVSPEEDGKAWERWAMEYAHRLPLRVEVLTERTPSRLITECERAVDDGARLCIVDYLQVFSEIQGERITDPQKEFLAIRYLSRKLRQFALKTGAHVLAISARNRNDDGRGRPSLSSLYGGTGLEHDCTEAFILRRYADTLTEYEDEARKKELETEERRTGRCLMILDVAKAREGITGALPFTYNKRTQQFLEGHMDKADGRQAA